MNDTDSRSRWNKPAILNMFLSHPPKRERAFTRIELLAVCVALLLVALVMTPAAVSSKSDSERMICFNNLRLLGRGVQSWAGAHNMQFSWRTPVADGGTLPESTKPGNAWFECFYLSNELVTPKILACPSDAGVNRATNWLQFGFAQFRNQSLSYLLHLDGSMDVPTSWLSADRNLRVDPGFSTCSARINNANRILTTPFPSNSIVAWSNGVVHGEFGHVLTTDGTVEFTSTRRAKRLLAYGEGDNGSTHFLKGR